MTATWLADELRAAGCTVVEHPGWQTRSHGEFTDLGWVVWHHDASAPGDSPGVPAFMLSRWNVAAAQLWVARDGTWHVLAAGVAWHAGSVLPGKPGNRQSLGVETDHTVGEPWPAEQLDSLRRGTTAILRRLGVDASRLEFHKTICSPPGRKVDPDGLDLTAERQQLAALLSGAPAPAPAPGSAPAAPTSTGDDMDEIVRRWGLLRQGTAGQGVQLWQGLLVAMGRQVTVDGDFGPATDRATRDWQSAAAVPGGADGVVGANTWGRALGVR